MPAKEAVPGFQQLGERIAVPRQRHGLSQAVFSSRTGLKQRTWAAYEAASRRLPSSLLLPAARALDVSLDELMAADPVPDRSKGKPGPVPGLQRQLDQVARLPLAKQKFASEFPGTVLQAAGCPASAAEKERGLTGLQSS